MQGGPRQRCGPIVAVAADRMKNWNSTNLHSLNASPYNVSSSTASTDPSFGEGRPVTENQSAGLAYEHRRQDF